VRGLFYQSVILNKQLKLSYTIDVKQIVIIDESPLFREYLRDKLTENDIEATAAINGLDGLAKIRNIIPDLIIMDYDLSRQGCMDVLKQKKASPNLAPVPVIVTARQFNQERVIELAAYNVKKVFTKPVKMEALFIAITDLLKVSIEVDKSPGIVEVHVNDDIIFVEITEGLNRDKLDLLSFKISELMELYEIREPKIIIMISGISLGFGDTPNLKKLFNNVLKSSLADQKNIRILTKEEFIRDFLKYEKEYREIETTDNLQSALDGLTYIGGADEETQAVIIGDKVLSGTNAQGESMILRFDGESKAGMEEIKESLKGLKVAVVDDDELIRELVKNTFGTFEIDLKTYVDGSEFIYALAKEHFDLIFLDIIMPRADGFAVLNELKDKKIDTPVIVFSAINQRDTVIRAFQKGVKSYMTKPIQQAGIFKKTLEILRVNF